MGIPSYVMPEYRQNPLTKEWVILSCERQARPSEFLDQPARRESSACPFCWGNEHETPAEIARYCDANDKGSWSVRVVPNKYPAVSLNASSRERQPACNDECLFRTAPALGEHEVIIESPRHVVSLTDLTLSETEYLFLAYRDRIAAHRAAGQAQYVQIFKNVGSLAGASIEHSHSQLMALEQLPQDLEREVAIADGYYRRNGRSLMNSVLQAELEAGTRVVAESANFAAFCPFASRFPYEICLAAKTAGGHFEELQAGELGELAAIVREIIGRIESMLGPIAYNYYLRPAPFDIDSSDQYDWHIEIFPRLVKVAGFEWSTGVFINTVSPEVAAKALRSLPDQRGN
jgi:UDPglucose--hexose-1-phosphate uridylyltransferase